MHAEAGGDVVQPVGEGAIRRLLRGGELGGDERGREPVLVGDRVRDRVAEGLLVAEDETGSGACGRGAGDPLETGEGLGVVGTGFGGERGEQRRRDDRRRDEPARSRPSSEEVVAEERAELVAAEHPECAGAVGEGNRQAVGVGVVGEDDVGTDLPGPGEGEVECSRLLGVRERDGREIRVRIGLPFDEGRRIESRTDEELREDRTPDSVEGRVDDPQLARPVRLEDRRDRRRVGGKQRGLVEALDEGARSAPRAGLRCRAEFGGEVGDPRVVRGDHLGAVGGVGLVAVVGRRVVARGDHHAGRGTQLTHGEGGDRRGQGAGKGAHAHARRRRHRRDVLGEGRRAVAGVVADDDARTAGRVALVRDPAGESRRRRAHDGPVHPPRAGAERAAQAGGPEHEGAVETGPQRLLVASLEEPLELGPGRRIRVAVDPRQDLVDERAR